jgi:hypothetical protein
MQPATGRGVVVGAVRGLGGSQGRVVGRVNCGGLFWAATAPGRASHWHLTAPADGRRETRSVNSRHPGGPGRRY